MIKLYGIKNCDTVRKAQKWLAANDIEFEFVDYRENPLTATQLKSMHQIALGENLVNTRGTTFRTLTETEKQSLKSDTPDFELLAANPTIIKRPVIDTNGATLVGFDDTLYTEYLLES